MKYVHHRPVRSTSIWLVESGTRLQDSQSTDSILSLRTSKGCRFGAIGYLCIIVYLCFMFASDAIRQFGRVLLDRPDRLLPVLS